MKRSAADWRRAVGYALAWLTGCALLVPTTPLLDVARADFGISAGILIVSTILSSLFGLFRGRRVDYATGRAIDGLRGGVVDLGRELVNMGVRLGGAVAAGMGAVKRLIVRALRPIIEAVSRLWQRVVSWLDRIFGPIVNFLMRVRDHIWRFYNKWIRPILDAIAIVRTVLQILARFGVDWARRLDQQLYRLEQYLTAPFEFLIAKINEALSWINRIVTVDGLLQRWPLLNATWRDIQYLRAQWWRGQHKPLTAEQRAAYILKPIHPNGQVDSEAWEAWIRRNDGPLAPKIREFQANVKLNARIAQGRGV